MNVLDIPMYTSAMASRLLGVTPTRIRRWLKGYYYIYGAKTREKGPVVHGRQDVKAASLSFLDLIELKYIKAFLDDGVSLQKVRDVLKEVIQQVRKPHPFTQSRFYAFNRHIYLARQGGSEEWIELLTGGQKVFTDVIEPFSHQIEFDKHTHYALRWFPLGKENPIVIDPNISFGYPSIVGKRVATSTIFDLFQGEKRNYSRVC